MWILEVIMFVREVDINFVDMWWGRRRSGEYGEALRLWSSVLSWKDRNGHTGVETTTSCFVQLRTVKWELFGLAISISLTIEL